MQPKPPNSLTSVRVLALLLLCRVVAAVNLHDAAQGWNEQVSKVRAPPCLYWELPNSVSVAELSHVVKRCFFCIRSVCEQLTASLEKEFV